MKCSATLAALLLPMFCCGAALALSCYDGGKLDNTCVVHGGWCLSFVGKGLWKDVRGAGIKLWACDSGSKGCMGNGCQSDVSIPDPDAFPGIKGAVGELCCCDDRDKCNGGGVNGGRAPAVLIVAGLAALAHRWWY